MSAGSISGARIGEILAEIVAGTSHTGQAHFESLVLCLSRALGVRWALVGERPAGPARIIRTLGHVADGALQPPCEYALEGTPCAHVMGGEVCYYPEGVADLFPADAMLREIGASSYLGVPLHSSRQEPIGILVVLHDGAIASRVDPAVVLQIFAGRAAAELERLRHERELAEQERRLRFSEEMFSKVFRSSPAAITISDLATGRMVDVNEAFVAMRGLSRESVVGRPAVELGLWDNETDRAHWMEMLRRDGRVREMLMEVPGPAGQRLIFRASAEILDIAGQRYLLTVSEHVTDRVRAELALKRSEERLRLALDAARLGAWEWTIDPDTMVWSDRENHVCGYPEGTPLRTFADYLERMHPDDRPRLEQAVQEARAGADTPYVCEHRVTQPDGGYRWVEIRGKVFRDGSGRPLRLAGTLADIDERKRTSAELEAATDRLRRSEEMFAKVFRSCPAPIVIARPEARGIVDVNDAFLEATGFERSQVIGRSGIELGLWSADEREVAIATVLGEGRRGPAPIEVNTPRGRRSMLMSAEITEIAGEPHYLVMAHDITEWLDAERRLKASEERWRRLSEAAFEGIAVTHEGRMLDANDQLARMLGYSLDELIGRPVMDLVAPESREEVGRRVAERSTEPYEHVALTKDGARIPVEARGQFFVEAERALRVTAVRDMTQRKRLEAELFAAAREWNECFDAMPVGLVIADREGRILRANRQLLEWSGHSAFRDLIGRRLDGLSPDEPWPTLMRLAQAGGRGAVAAEASNARTRTAWRVAWSEFPRSTGEVPATILVVRDVTEETRLRDELRRQETLAAMGSLVAGVAHEVRTPLFSISATLDAFSEGTPEELEEGARLLRAQVKRLGNLMSDLLDYGKPPALQLEDGGIGDVVDRAVRACESLATDAQVAVRVDRNGSMPVVRRDARRLEQAFQNLVANAIQHSPRGGTVHVVTEAAAAGVECRVEDEGVGIPEENLPRLFEPFFTRRKGGTGLGLPIVQRIVEAHGGRVAAANRLHRGAVFTVTLPVAAGGTEVLGV